MELSYQIKDMAKIVRSNIRMGLITLENLKMAKEMDMVLALTQMEKSTQANGRMTCGMETGLSSMQMETLQRRNGKKDN